MAAVWSGNNKTDVEMQSGKNDNFSAASLKDQGCVFDAQAEIRRGFITKVYGILSIQMVLSVGMAVLFMFEPNAHAFVLSSPGAFQATSILPLFVLVALICNKNKYPLNMYLLSLFTVLEAYTVGTICAVYQEAGHGAIVLQAFVLTASIFCSLTAYAFFSKRDFSFLGAGLSSALWMLIIWSLMNAFFPATFGFSRGVFALFGAGLFCLYILYDTSMIMRRLGPDDYIMAAVDLYLDIINLFLFILEILSRNSD